MKDVPVRAVLTHLLDRQALAPDHTMASSRLWRAGMGVVFVAIVLTRMVAIADSPEAWLDEAMLIVNLPLRSLPALFAPLPYYEQAAPGGYLLLASLAVDLFPGWQIGALRMLSACASLGAAVFLTLALKRIGATAIAPLAVALAFLSPFGVRYGVEIKQYAFELLAACLVFYASARAALSPDRAGLAILFAAGVFTILFSFAAPAILCAFAAGALAQAWADDPRAVVRRDRLGLAAVFVVLIGIAVVYNQTITAAVVKTQIEEFARVYQRTHLKLSLYGSADGVGFSSYWRLVIGMFDPYYRMNSGYHAAKLFAAMAMVVFLVGLLAAARRQLLVAVATVAFFVGIAALSLLKAFPIAYTRHFIFMQPLVATVLAVGLAALVASAAGLMDVGLGRRPAVAALSAVVIAATALVGGRASLSQQRQNLSDVLKVIASETKGKDALIWLSLAGQPAMQLLAPGFKTQIGYMSPLSVDKRFSRELWAKYYPSLVPRMAQYDSIWLIYVSFFADERRNDASFGFFAAHYRTCQEKLRSGADEDLGQTLLYHCVR